MGKPMKALIAGVLASMLLATLPARGQIQQQQVQFKKGETGATIKGGLKGEQIIDYKLRADAGQVMVVKFRPTNPSAYFNVLPPESEEAIHIGSSAGNDFSGDLAASGEYRIRVYLMRNAARRNESVTYTLEVAVSGTPRKTGAAPTAAAAPAHRG
jgi:hypothetical protein